MDDRYRPEDKGVANAIAVVIDILPRVFRFLWEVSPGLLALSRVLLFIMALIPAAIVWMTNVIIDLVVVSAGTENGAGKTTIIKLLTRLYDPTGGAVLVDSVPA